MDAGNGGAVAALGGAGRAFDPTLWALELRYQHHTRRAAVLEQVMREAKATDSASQKEEVASAPLHLEQQLQDPPARGRPIDSLGASLRTARSGNRFASSPGSTPNLLDEEASPSSKSADRIAEELSYLKGVIRGEEIRWQRESEQREVMEAEFEQLKAELQQEERWRSAAEQAEANLLEALASAEVRASAHAANLRQICNADPDAAARRQEAEMLSVKHGEVESDAAAAASTLAAEQHAMDVVKAEVHAVMLEAERMGELQSEAYGRDIEVTKAHLEEELAAKISQLSAGELTCRVLDETFRSVCRAYDVELQVAASEHAVQMGRRVVEAEEASSEMIYRRRRADALANLEADVSSLKGRCRTVEESYREELEEAKRACVVFEQAVREECDIAQEEVSRMSHLRRAQELALPANCFEVREVNTEGIEARWQRFVLSALMLPLSVQLRRCQAAWSCGWRGWQARKLELAKQVSAHPSLMDSAWLEELSMHLERAELERAVMEKSHADRINTVADTVKVLQSDVQTAVALWSKQVSNMREALSASEASRQEAENAWREAEDQASQLRFTLALEKASLEGGGRQREALTERLQAEMLQERAEVAALSESLAQAESAIKQLLGQQQAMEAHSGSVPRTEI